MLKSFFVAYNGSEHAGAALDYACFLASLAQGRIHVGCVVEMNYASAISTGMAAGSIEYVTAAPMIESVEELAEERKAHEAQADAVLAQARRICEKWGVAHDTRRLGGWPDEEILVQALAVDLAALGKSDQAGNRQKVGHQAEAIVRSSPQPALIATAPFAHPTEIIVLDNGGERSLHALGIAAEVAHLARLPLRLITVSPTREEGEAVSRRGGQYLGDHDVEFQSVTIASESPDHELVRQLNEQPTALVLMGAFGQSRIREWLTGGTTRAILRETRNPLILFRH